MTKYPDAPSALGADRARIRCYYNLHVMDVVARAPETKEKSATPWYLCLYWLRDCGSKIVLIRTVRNASVSCVSKGLLRVHITQAQAKSRTCEDRVLPS